MIHRALIQLLTFQFQMIQILFRSIDDLVLEIIELRQQLATYQAKKKQTKVITDINRSLLVALKGTWTKWKDALVIVKPPTIID